MRRYYFLVLLIVLTFLQSTIVPLNLVLISLSSWVFFRNLREIYISAFVAGLLLDFLSARFVGVTVLFLLILMTFTYLVRARFIHTEFPSVRAVLPLFLIILTFGEIVFETYISLVLGSARFDPNWKTIIIQDIAGFVLFPIFYYLSLRWPKEEQLELRF